jgi:hypothetical protein
MAAPAPAWMSRYLPDVEPAEDQSWAAQLAATDAEVAAAEAERVLQEERLREAAHSGRPLSQRPGARRMREHRARQRLQQEGLSPSCVQR